MIFTLYYMYATLLQWWRIGVTKKKLSNAITNQSSIVIYQKDRQINHSSIEDVIFLQGDKVGCTIVPRKKISIDNWLPFSTKNFFPFSKKRYTKIDAPNFTVLIQADLKSFNNGFDYDKLQLTELGVPMAWTASDSFGVVLRTDLDNFSKLVSCFLANPIAINEGMEVLQVEVIDIEGEPKRLDDKLIRKIKWPKIITSNKQWKHLIDDLKNICKKVNQICSSQNGNIHKEISPERISHCSKNSLEVETRYGSKSLLTVSKKSENHHDHKHKSRGDKEEKHKHGSRRDRHESEGTKHGVERNKHGGERDKHSGERDKHSGDRDKHSGDRDKHSGEREKHSGDRDKHSGEKDGVKDKYAEDKVDGEGSKRDKLETEQDKYLSKKDKHESEGDRSPSKRDRYESEGEKSGVNKLEKYTIEIPENIRYKEKRKSIMELVQHPDIQIVEETKLEPLICKIQDQVEKKNERAKGERKKGEEKYGEKREEKSGDKKEEKHVKKDEKEVRKIEEKRVEKMEEKCVEKSEAELLEKVKNKYEENAKGTGSKRNENFAVTTFLVAERNGGIKTGKNEVEKTETNGDVITEKSSDLTTENVCDIIKEKPGVATTEKAGTVAKEKAGNEKIGITEKASVGTIEKAGVRTIEKTGVRTIEKAGIGMTEKAGVRMTSKAGFVTTEKTDVGMAEKASGVLTYKDVVVKTEKVGHIKPERNGVHHGSTTDSKDPGTSEKKTVDTIKRTTQTIKKSETKHPDKKETKKLDHKYDKKSESKRTDEPSSSKTLKDTKVERHKKFHKKSEKGSPEKTMSVESTTESDSLESEKKLPTPEKSDKSKNKRTKELTQDKIKQSSSMDRIRRDSDKHKKELHKTKREKFAKRYSDDRLLNVEIDKDISKISDKKLEPDEGVRIKKRFTKAKSPNVLVCADSLETRENVKTVLKSILNNNKYIIYELPVAGDPYFAENSTLVIVCGNVTPNLKHQLLTYFLNGGNLLCLCSDFLNSVLPTFTTAEVREHELVRFSYGEWKRVRMMHHIFCYQASPVKKHFSQDSSDQNSSNQSSGNSPVAPRTPASVELHHNNKNYMVQVQVLGQEETWHTPSILLAKVKNGTGKAVFSQVHLEVDPVQYEGDETKFITLRDSNKTRLAIIKDILSNYLNMDCINLEKGVIEYKLAYFLGRHESKQELLFKMPNLKDNILRLPKLTLQFCGRDVIPPPASDKLLPILVHSCPERFSTVKYFDNLKSDIFGRLVIYSDIMTSSMDVVTGAKLKHGIVVIPYEQTTGKGRGGNLWLSPKGCAMFSIQLHVPMDSALGRSLPLVQLVVAVAVVSAIRSLPGYENLSIGLKWPNDIYAYSSVKIGGLIVNSMVESTVAICNIGCGINLKNPEPTTCINSIIRKYNEDNGTKLDEIPYEKLFAITFTELERIYNIIQQDNINYLYELYYKYWLHSDSVVSVQTSENTIKDVLITGIDTYGYLVVRAKDGSTSSVQPDNNTFDIMQGLIAPKIR